MANFLGFLISIAAFLVVLTVLVFVHELGHYLSARRNGVRIEVFSIGFGKEIFGRTDKAGTRWKFSAIPLGGYVKMYGDANAASQPGEELVEMTEEEKAISFHHKKLLQRAEIVAAGPIANFLFAIVVFFFLFWTFGNPIPPAVVGEVLPGSPAAEAGLEPGDRILSVDGQTVFRFRDLGNAIRAAGGDPVVLVVRHAGGTESVTLTPQMVAVETADGGSVDVPRIGVAMHTGPVGFTEAAPMAVTETYAFVKETLRIVGQMIVGNRGTEDLGGPVRIAKTAGDVAKTGQLTLLWYYMALLSISLGLINLFPIPILDGGHLLFYAIEAVRGRPLGERAQEYGFRIGLALVLTLMIFVTFNDLIQLKVIAFLRELI